jgi:hypothetical protein
MFVCTWGQIRAGNKQQTQQHNTNRKPANATQHTPINTQQTTSTPTMTHPQTPTQNTMSVSTNPKNVSEIDSEQTFETIPPLSKQTYTTKEDMMASLQEFACQHGFSILTANSAFSKGQNKIKYQYDQSGEYCPHQKSDTPAVGKTTK